MQEHKQDYKIMLETLSPKNRSVMQKVYDLMEELKHTDELVAGKLTNGFWNGLSFYLRHNKVGKTQGKWIYFSSKSGKVLEIETKYKKFFFGDGFSGKYATPEYTEDMLSHIKKVMNK